MVYILRKNLSGAHEAAARYSKRIREIRMRHRLETMFSQDRRRIRLMKRRRRASTRMFALPIREATAAFHLEYLNVQFQRFGGSISKTAEFVGMERSALHRKMKALRKNKEMGGAW